MDIQANHLLSEAMKLSPEDREDLAARLMGSVVPVDTDEPLAPEWDAEIAQRVEDIVSGRIQGVPADEVHQKMQERLGE